MVRDAHGRKMSKSLGNVIDPMDVIRGISLGDLHKTLEGGNLDPKEIARAKEGQKQDYPDGIPECGTDALRFALCAYTAQGRLKLSHRSSPTSLNIILSGRDINLDVLRVQGYRFFCNKLWNATKFAMRYLGSGFSPKKNLVQNLFRQTSSSKKAYSYVALPPLSEMNTPATLELLNSCLQTSTFLAGSDPTKVDVEAFKSFKDSPSYWQFKPLCQWYHRMNAFTPVDLNKLPGAEGILAPQPAPLSRMDKWILSRLNFAAASCNEGMTAYNFPQATTALYNFWLYELCDVYLECLKPVFQGTDARSIMTARNVLYTCLDGGLRLISPFMPYISEELFQRLPRKSMDEPPSIMVTAYPTGPELAFRTETIECEVESVQKVVGVIRSTRADYNLPNKVKTEVYLQTFDDKAKGDLEGYKDVIGTLAYCSRVDIGTKPPSSGCAIVTVSDKCSAHLGLKGLIEPTKEVEKLTKKRAALEAQKDKLIKAAKVAGYEQKVPEDVRKANNEKIKQSETEIQRLGEAIDAIKAL